MIKIIKYKIRVLIFSTNLSEKCVILRIIQRDAVKNVHRSSCKVRYAVVQLVEALRYKPEGHWFDSRLCHWNFSLT